MNTLVKESPLVYSLWEDAIPFEDIPKYPTYTLKRAVAGDYTYKLNEKLIPYVDMIEQGGKPSDVFHEMQSRGIAFEPPEKVLAEEGELLLDGALRYIPDTTENVLWRAEIRLRCEEDVDFRALQYNYCKSDIRYWINTFGWTFDPRLKNPHIPFITYPIQDKLLGTVIYWIDSSQDGLCEKSRDFGATWCAGSAIDVWSSLFYPGFVSYDLSLREEDVDNRSEDSLLGKSRYMFQRLPDWMRGGWVERQQGVDAKMLIRIPDTGSTIRGQLSGNTAARGGRGRRAFYDESAFYDDDDKVMKAAASLSDSPLWLSTANGMGNGFYRMANDPYARKITLHWREHPMKNSAWALRERSKMSYTDESWAQEQEIAYDTSTSHRVFPGFKSTTVDEFVWSHVQYDEYFKYDYAYPVYTFWDFGIRDPTSLIFAQIKPTLPHFSQFGKECLVIFAEEEKSDRDVKEWAKLVNSKQENGLPYRYREHIGDFRSGNQRTPTLKTWIEYLGQLGIHIKGRVNNEFAPIFEVEKRLAIPGAVAIYAPGAPNAVKAFQNWSFPEDKKTGLVITGSKPKHDQWSHCMKAICYGIDWIYSTTSLPGDDVEWQFQRIKKGRMV